MSDAKKFGPKAIASAEDRLTEIERKYSVIQERIQAYDAVLSEFQALKANLVGNRKSVESFVAASGSIFEDLRLKVDTYGAQFQILHSKAESNAKALEDHKQLFSKFVGNHNKVVSDFNEVVTKLKNDIDKSLNHKTQVINSLAQNQDAIGFLNASRDSIKTSLDKLTDAHIKFKDSSEASQTELAKQHAKLSKTVASLPSLQEWANTLYAKFQQDMGYREKQATAYVDTKVKQLAKDFDANPLSAESIKTALFNEIQALALDGKNAYLKSNNCATQLALLEKKLENLNLLIKKHELTK